MTTITIQTINGPLKIRAMMYGDSLAVHRSPNAVGSKSVGTTVYQVAHVPTGLAIIEHRAYCNRPAAVRAAEWLLEQPVDWSAVRSAADVPPEVREGIICGWWRQ